MSAPQTIREFEVIRQQVEAPCMLVFHDWDRGGNPAPLVIEVACHLNASIGKKCKIVILTRRNRGAVVADINESVTFDLSHVPANILSMPRSEKVFETLVRHDLVPTITEPEPGYRRTCFVGLDEHFLQEIHFPNPETYLLRENTLEALQVFQELFKALPYHQAKTKREGDQREAA